MGEISKDDMRVVNNFITEDEFNNLLIEMWQQEQEEIASPICGEPITITLTPANYYNQNDIELG